MVPANLKETVSMSSMNAPLGSLQGSVLEKYVMAGQASDGSFFTDGDLRSLRMLDGLTADGVAELLSKENNAVDVGKAATRVFETVVEHTALYYTLRKVEACLVSDLPRNAVLLFGAGEARPERGASVNLGSVVRLVGHEQDSVATLATYICALLMSVSLADNESQVVHRTFVLSSLMDSLRNAADAVPEPSLDARERAVRDSHEVGPRVPDCLQSLAVVLRNEETRDMFVRRDGLHFLMRLIDSLAVRIAEDEQKQEVVHQGALDTNSQYQLVLCLWLTLFNADAAQAVRGKEMTSLVNLLRSEPKTRVTRLVLSAIRIALGSGGEDLERILCQSLIEKNLPKLLAHVSSKKQVTGSDLELKEDMQWILETLTRNFKVLSTFDRHRQELLGGRLSRSVIHEEIFWKENALKFENDNFASVKMLVDILKSAQDVTSICLACSDLGFFVQYFPQGKLIVEKYGGKAYIMELLAHSSPEVKRQALSACSKLMVNNWSQIKLK